MSVIEQLIKATISGNPDSVVESANQALSEKLKPETIIQEGLIPVMEVVGDKVKDGEIFVHGRRDENGLITFSTGISSSGITISFWKAYG